MESMRRSEVNVSHHPNKVATNSSVVTESTKHNKLVGSSSSTPISAASNLNKKLNTSSHKQHQYQNNTKHNANRKVASSRNLGPTKSNLPQSSEGVSVGVKGWSLPKPAGKPLHVSATKEGPLSSVTAYCSSSTPSEATKDTNANFEYEDEWDIGGIPELLDDLDADIEKSSTAAQNLSKVQNSSGGGKSEFEAITSTLKSATKSTTSNKANIAHPDNLLQKPSPSSIGKLLPSPLSRSLTASVSSFPASSNEKFALSTKCSQTVPLSRNTNKYVGGIVVDKSINNSATLSNIGRKYPQQPSEHKNQQQIQISNFEEQSVNSGPTSKVASAPTKSPSSLSPSLSSSSSASASALTAPFSCNSESGQKSNTLTLSTFAGFSKGGNLVSSFTKSLIPSGASAGSSNLTTALETDSLSNLSNQSASGMSSQSSGSSSNNSSVGGGAGGGQGGSQGIGGGSGGGKSNAKMSIDHQATLDKGLKMKIKRTKPGTKTSEAKHEIVKATEQQQQQQNGSLGVNNSSNLDENSGLNTTSHSSSSSGGASGSGGSNQNTGSSAGGSGSNVTSISGSNKKHLSNISSSSSGSQGNSHNSINSNSPASGGGSTGTGSSGQVTPQSNKRGSSGHRREKAKEKTTHSNRLTAEKNASAASEKEGLPGHSDKGMTCHCIIDATSGSATGACSSHACSRRSESATNSSITVLTQQRICNTTGNSNSTSGSVPPGVFTPSLGSPAGVVTTAAATAASLLAATSVASATAPQAIGSNSAPNAPGPPGKDSTNCGNIKISSHIAAQLAAAAASTSFSNSVPNTHANSLSGSGESKSSTSMVPVAQAKHMAPGVISATVHHTISVPANSSTSTTTASSSNSSTSNNNLVAEDGIKSPPAKRAKHGNTDTSHAPGTSTKEMVDICIGTSVGTITEPDCLGPCEPGTSVTLEGIVWHETEGGVLVVNVTWRGKTYVGTLLDCTRHDWAPPRFCDSPTEELDSRTPKGRGKRGRSAALTPDLSNFTETRSSIYFSHAQVHSKLRNGTTKGGRGASRTAISATSTANTTTITSSSSSGNGGGATPSTSPTAFLPPRSEKRKSKDESPSPINGDSECPTNVANASGIPISASGGGLATQPQSLVNPVTGLNVQISTKKCKTASPCAISPVLLECPEQDCSKKYKHANGLRYHQSHAHGSACSMDEDSLQLPEEPPTPTSSPVPPSQNTRTVTPTPAEGSVLPAGVVAIPSPETPPISTSTIPASTTEPPSQPTAALSTSSQSATQTTNLEASIESETLVGIAAAATSSATNSAISSSILNSSVPVTAPASASSTSAAMGGILTASVTQPQPLMPQSQQSHPVAGGSITAGISGQVLSQQQQQQQQQSVGMPNASNIPVLLSEQTQTSTLPQQVGPKPGVLRFGPQSDSPNPGAASSILALQQHATPGTSPQVNPLAGQSPQRAPMQLNANSESLPQPHQSSISSYSGSSASSGQNLQGISLSTKNAPGFVAVKQKKCRKSPGPVEYDGAVTRDNVQSPAYSDISDDSTPVGEQDILDKSHPKHLDLPTKKPSDLGAVGIGSGSQAIPPLGGYGMYQFYQQQQYLVPPPSSDQQPSQNPKQGLLPSTLVQAPLTLPSSQSQQQSSMQSSLLMQQQQQQQQQHQQQQQQSPLLADYNKSKDPPLDLISKSSQQQQQVVGHQPQMQSQDGAGNQKDNNTSGQPPQASANLGNVGPPNNGLPPGMAAMQSLGSSGVGPGSLPTPSPAKPLSHFYPFNYMAPGYPYNVEPNYGPVSIVASDDTVKLGNHGNLPSSQPQNTGPPHSSASVVKDERLKESPSPHECSKQMPQQQQLVSSKLIKSEPMAKQEIKQEHNSNAQSQQQQQQQQQPPQQQQQQQPQQPHALHPKDLQGLGTYPNIYQRHPMSLAAQQHLSREEELRRYYILSDEQRRQNAVAALRAVQAQNPSNSGPPGSLQNQVLTQHKEDTTSSAQHQQQMAMVQQQQQHQQSQKSKSQSCSTSSNVNAGSGKATNLTKEVSKQKQEEDVKIKQEGQKPTMETQGPPPPPTSQYFLHPSYIAPAPFSFDPNHPMYRNVLMSAAGPYNTAPYHLPIPRYHAPEDLSRNTGTKALDALHHAASQYYTTHKIHELSERALKSPTSGSNSGLGGAVKVSVSSPNVGIQQQQQQQAMNSGGVTGPGSGPNAGQNAPNSGSHLSGANQSSGGSGIPLNLQPPPTGMSGPTNKSDVLNQKVLSGPGSQGGNLTGGPLSIDSHKQQSGTSGPNSGGNIGGGGAPGPNGATTDSRSPPPQRHVHTHHHTHVGLGYPMYTAPYGAAVLASQQAAAVAVINPFPPGPTK
ncbi:PREDICTED: mucin-19 [Rhagoletis zephyria]|uniref:mucin-19 n=1 Tax=Rhagoletis zephyria TaxID=28612 RepID=UPI0008114026|nr:PREDICTED: mucin-19 [Rhagoletis zephyria]